MLKDQKAEAQKVLDQLWNEQLIPFPLTVGKLTTEHSIHFHDSRIRIVEIFLSEGQPFVEGVRAAVLERVKRMSGPLGNSVPAKIGS